MSRARLVVGSVGVAVMAGAAWSLATGGTLTAPASLGTWLLVPVLVHDLIIAPLVCAGAVLARRLLPQPTRAVVQGGLAVAGVLLIVGLPFLLSPGSPNPTVLTRDYPRGLAAALGVVLAATAVAAVAAEVSRRAGRPGRSGPPRP